MRTLAAVQVRAVEDEARLRAGLREEERGGAVRVGPEAVGGFAELDL